MRVVIAIGGNALLQRGEPLSLENQLVNIQKAAKSIAEIAKSHDIILVHGNGPQVGLLALEALSYKAVPPYSLDVLGAETQGMIGYLLQQALHNYLPTRQIVTLLTRVEVSKEDAGFTNPTKPIGPIYSKTQAEKMVRKYGWEIKADGAHFRRVVPSPQPLSIIELDIIKTLIEKNTIVICTGGGGIPVIQEKPHFYEGVEAVIDKDLSASLLATHLNADAFIILTDVKAVAQNWNTPDAEIIHKTTANALRKLSFESGSMGPKIDAACRFVEQSVGFAAIGALEDGLDILNQKAGTIIVERE